MLHIKDIDELPGGGGGGGDGGGGRHLHPPLPYRPGIQHLRLQGYQYKDKFGEKSNLPRSKWPANEHKADAGVTDRLKKWEME